MTRPKRSSANSFPLTKATASNVSLSLYLCLVIFDTSKLFVERYIVVVISIYVRDKVLNKRKTLLIDSFIIKLIRLELIFLRWYPQLN